ncbi:MAG: hypothetical protein WBO19_19415 [Terriglobia bacterium]
MLGNTLGGEFYQTFQAIASYLWRVERCRNSAEKVDHVSLPQLRRADQFEKFRRCGKEDRPFGCSASVRRVPEPDCNTAIQLRNDSLFHLGRRIAICEFEGFWMIFIHQTIARYWTSLSPIPASGFLVIQKPMADAKDSN